MTLPTPDLTSSRLRLDALTVDDASAMVAVLADPGLYRFTGGEPPNQADLERRYAALVAGSGDPSETWHNWIVRVQGSAEPVGFVQATLYETSADVAWTIQPASQGQGYAGEAAQAMVEWLLQHVAEIQAYIHPDHVVSQRIATRLGMTRTTAIDEDGEEIWSTAAS